MSKENAPSISVVAPHKEKANTFHFERREKRALTFSQLFFLRRFVSLLLSFSLSVVLTSSSSSLNEKSILGDCRFSVGG
jgi:hypothetical protein